uniref:Transducin/WD40 repeat-like superfamily protein n=1 Tax=Mesocestoides corti TaxID=53468 RepID=A0A5K3FHX8_MESCO
MREKGGGKVGGGAGRASTPPPLPSSSFTGHAQVTAFPSLACTHVQAALNSSDARLGVFTTSGSPIVVALSNTEATELTLTRVRFPAIRDAVKTGRDMDTTVYFGAQPRWCR